MAQGVGPEFKPQYRKKKNAIGAAVMKLVPKFLSAGHVLQCGQPDFPGVTSPRPP
jgi:hypothetical protein